MGWLLLATIMMPLIGAFACLAVAQRSDLARIVALVVSLITLAGVIGLISQFPADGKNASEFALLEFKWLSGVSGNIFDVRFSLGLDGLGLWLYGLTAVLVVSSILVSWESINTRQSLFYAMLLMLECGCLGVFTARDIILFYVFFEFTLIPLFFLIGIWGSEDRRYAAAKFFIYTLAGSVLTFLGLLAVVLWQWQTQRLTTDAPMVFSIPELTQSLRAHPMPVAYQHWVFLALLAGFAIKVPLVPFHTWLPLAHVQAPTAGSVLLAGVLLKIGTYGFIRFSIPLLPDATVFFVPLLLWVSVVGIVYGALVALAQSDMKRLIAYSSVSHLGFCMLGLFALNRLGIQGSVLQMVNHGISTGGLFAIIGMLYERYHTRRIKDLQGLAAKIPIIAFFMIVFTLSSIGLPGLNGFAGEILILIGVFQRAGPWNGWELNQFKWIAILALSGVVLGAWYMLWLVQRVFFGTVKEPVGDDEQHSVPDIKGREIGALAPLAVLALWIGVYPQFFLQRMAPTLNEITDHTQQQVRIGQSDPPKEKLARAR